MTEALEWLRPGWLLALPAGLALAWAWWRAHAGSGPWQRLVDADLLAHLAGPASRRSARLALGIAAAALALGCIALAGPSWRTQFAPLHRDQSARIVVLDLSPSMDAVDVMPSRLERARAASAALLGDAAGARLGLVVFGADAFTVAPLMRDPAPLAHLLGGLGPATVPRAGSRPDLGLDMARTLLARAGITAGEVILVGDSAGDARAQQAARALADAGFPLSVLAVGTAHGGPVRLAGGAFARTEAGGILTTRPDLASLERLAREGGGRFHLLVADGETPRVARHARDWGAPRGAPARASAARQDDGAWFALLALPFAALLFRRGWLACLAALALALPPPQAQAFDWPDLWRRADQQAAAQFARGPPAADARLLARLGPESPWYAMLLYRGAHYEPAAAEFAASDTADAHYNRGNALALDGRLEAALAAYGAALERSPAMPDALHNRALVRDALARRRALAQQGGDALEGEAPGASAPSSTRRGAGSRLASPGEAAAPRQERADTAPARGWGRSTAKRRDDADDAQAPRHFDGRHGGAPEDSGTLLANRFAQQLRMRSTWQHDPGARW